MGERLLLAGLIGTALFSISYFLLVSKATTTNITLIMTCFFGLVHGFGFGGYLSEIGLPSDRLASALLGFNLGVELGQILIVLLFLLGAKLISFKRSHFVGPLVASFLVSLGLYWFLVRIF